MLVSSISPMIANDENPPSLEIRETFSNSVSFVNGSGEQFAGETIVINSTNWTVDYDRGMDTWQTSSLNTNFDFDGIDVTLDDAGRARGCMHEVDGGIWLAKLEFGGTTSLSQVESGGPALGEKCSIVIDEREKAHIAYTDESGFLRLAYQTWGEYGGASLPWGWNIRTIENQSSVIQINLLLDSNGFDNILWLDSNNALHFSKYNTWWTHSELLAGTRINEGFDAYFDENGLNLFYQNLDSMQLIHGILDGNGNWSLSALDAGADLGPALSFSKDPSTGNIQYIYATDSSNSFKIVRDLSGQENGRISPSIDTITTGATADSYALEAFNDLDLNCDGIDDLIVNKPEAYSSKGAIEIFWGSQTSIS